MADLCNQILVTLKPGVGTTEMADVMAMLRACAHVQGATVVGAGQQPQQPEKTHLARQSGFVVVNSLGTVEERLGTSPMAGSMFLIFLELRGVLKGAKTLFELLNTHCPEVWTTDRQDEVRAYYSLLRKSITRQEKRLGRQSRFRLVSRRGIYGLERELDNGVIHDAGYAKLREVPHALLLELREEGMWA